MARRTLLALSSLIITGCSVTPEAINCRLNGGSIAETICRHPELTQLNEDLGRTLKTLQSGRSTVDTSALNHEQSIWQTELNSCWQSEMPHNCLRERLQTRNAHLQAEHRLVESSRLYRYFCDDDPDTPVVASYHLTEPATAILQRGDGRHLLYLSALQQEGALYYGDHISIRVSGDRAQISWGYRELSDPQSECRIHP